MATRSSRRINDDNNNIITNKLQQATLSSYQSHHQLHHHLLTTHTLLFHHIIIITYIIATICYSQCPSFSHFPSLRSLLSPLSLSLLRLREILSLSSTNLQIYILRRTLFLPFPTHRHNTGQNCHVIPQVAHPRQSGDHAKDPDTRSRHPEKWLIHGTHSVLIPFNMGTRNLFVQLRFPFCPSPLRSASLSISMLLSELTLCYLLAHRPPLPQQCNLSPWLLSCRGQSN